MFNKYIKYIVGCLFVFFQVQLSANDLKDNLSNSWVKITSVNLNNEKFPSIFKLNQNTPELVLNFDNVVWDVNHTSVNVIANDYYIDELGNNIPLTLGSSGNATIETVGTWPADFTLNTTTGVISTTASTNPGVALKYKICVGQLCKESSLIYQQKNDVIQVTKTISDPTNIKNGNNLVYTITIKNISNETKSVSFEEALFNNNTVLNNDQIDIVSWVFSDITNPSNVTTYPSTLLSIDSNNKLTGDFIIDSNKTITLTVTAKLKAVIVPTIKSITTVKTIDGSDNYLVNNENVEIPITVNLNAIDLGITSRIQDPNSTQAGNRITIRVTNVGTSSITSNSTNKIVVKLNLSSTTNNIYNVINGNFTLTNQIGDNEFTLNAGVILAPGEYREFSFTKDNFSDSGSNQVRTHTFNLTYTPDQNSANNVSTLTHRNSPIAGKISFLSSSDVASFEACYNGNFTIYSRTDATSKITGANIMNSYQVSVDGGLTWDFIKAAAVTETNVSGSSTEKIAEVDLAYLPAEGASTAKYEHQLYEIPITTLRNVIQVVFKNVTSNLKIRRYTFNKNQTDLYSWTEPIEVKVNQNTLKFQNDINSFSIVKGSQFTLPNVTTTYKSSIKYSSINGETGVVTEITNPQQSINLVLPADVESKTFEFLVEATTVSTGGNSNTNISPALGCKTSAIFIVIVYDPTKCNIYTKRTFATHVKAWTSGASGVANPEQAIPQTVGNVTTINRANAATLTGGVVLLGIGTVGIDLYFTDSNGNLTTLKNKKVVIKLGEQYSGLKVAGGLSVRAIKTERTASNLSAAPNLVGATYGVKGGVLDALKGDNVFEYSFVPATTAGAPVEFNGIRIQLGSLIGVADLASVFYAYIEEEEVISNNTNYCTLVNSDIIVTPPASLKYPTNQRDIDATYVKTGTEVIENTNIKLNRSAEDAYWGNYSEVLNVASSLSSIVFPYYAVDNDYDSYTLFNATAGVLNRQFLKTKLRQPARPGDQVQITLAYPNINVLNLSLLQLGNFKVVYYNKGAKVGEELLEQFRVLDIGLFRFRDKRRAILSRPVNFIYDEIELQQFNTVSVNLGDGLHIHDVRVNPLLAFDGQQDPKDVSKICATEPLKIQKPDYCTEYEVSLARVTRYSPNPYTIDSIGAPLLDYKGKPIYSIEEIKDFDASDYTALGLAGNPIVPITNSSNSQFSYFDLGLTKLIRGANYDGKLLIKIQAIRKGCYYGEPQYLRIDIENCFDGVVNPVINSGTK